MVGASEFDCRLNMPLNLSKPRDLCSSGYEVFESRFRGVLNPLKATACGNDDSRLHLYTYTAHACSTCSTIRSLH